MNPTVPLYIPPGMALDSTSTLTEVKAAYADNACYEEEMSATKCRAFITACRHLVRLLPKRAVHGGSKAEELEMSPDLIHEQIKDARAWLAANASVATGGPGVKELSMRDFRS